MKVNSYQKGHTDTLTKSDVLHPNRANVSKDELRQKLAELYKANKDQVSCFGFRTQYGGGKSTGFALIYDSHEVMKKFEPHYRLVRYGAATKVEKASRQQRMYTLELGYGILLVLLRVWDADGTLLNRQATQEPSQDSTGYGKNEERGKERQEVEEWSLRYFLCCDRCDVDNAIMFLHPM